jgi:predicted RNA-binding Zn ribbon-like protein
VLASPQTPDFDLSGGALCLDFANTWGDRGRAETDSLRSYSDLLAFARQAGILNRGQQARCAESATHDPDAASTTLSSARSLRDSLYRIFAALAAAQPPTAADLERLNAALPEGLSRLRLERRGAEFALTWAPSEPSLAAPLWPILRSAAELLVSEERRQIRECASQACSWLFLDRSRNRSRRWCSMETCGNRAKARRHYHRTRAQHGS